MHTNMKAKKEETNALMQPDNNNYCIYANTADGTSKDEYKTRHALRAPIKCTPSMKDF